MDEPWSDCSDQELVRRSAARDDRAFEQLVARYKNYVFSIARNVARNCNEHEHFDIVWQTFFKIWQVLGQCKPGVEFKSYLVTVARHTAITAWRRKKVESKHIPGRLHQGFDVASPEERPDQRLLSDEEARQIESIFAQMTEREALMLRMRWMEDRTLVQIASVIGLSVSRVCNLLVIARQHFRELWRQAGFDELP